VKLRVHACALTDQDAGAPTDSPTVPRRIVCYARRRSGERYAMRACVAQ
jgi:hypothetical protein